MNAPAYTATQKKRAKRLKKLAREEGHTSFRHGDALRIVADNPPREGERTEEYCARLYIEFVALEPKEPDPDEVEEGVGNYLDFLDRAKEQHGS